MNYRLAQRLHKGAHTMQRPTCTPLFSFLLACACGGDPGTANSFTSEHGAPSSGGDSEVTKQVQDDSDLGDLPKAGRGDAPSSEVDEAPGEGGASGESADDTPANAGAGGESMGEPGKETATCGDGVVQLGEYCDDGNAVRGDGCNPNCNLSGRSLDNSIEVLPLDQELHDLVLVKDQLYAVGASAENAKSTLRDKLVVTAHLGELIIEPVSLIQGDAGKDEALARLTTDGSYLYTAGHAEDSHQDPLTLFERRGMNGGFQWGRTIEGSGNIGGEGNGIALVGPNLVGIGHISMQNEGRDILIASLSKSNAKVPVKTSLSGFGSNDDYGCDIVPHGSGSVQVGLIHTSLSEREVWVRRADESGVPIWTKTYKSSASVHRVASGPGGEIALVGSVPGDGNADAWVTLLDADGTLLWSKSFNYGQNDWASGVTFDPENGDLIVVGSFEKYSWDIFVQRLAASGEQRWFTELDGYGFDDSAKGVALSDDGTIWTVGSWGGSADDSEYWIGKFSP